MVDVMSSVHTPVQENAGLTGVLIDMRPVTADELRDNSVEVITLRKNDEGFGFNIVGGTDSQHFPGEDGIFISQLKQGGPADSSGKLVPGDEIVSINNINLHGKTHDEVIQMFSDCEESATLIIDHGSEAKILREGEIHSVIASLTGVRSVSRSGGNPQPTTINQPLSNESTTSTPIVLAETSEESPTEPKEKLQFNDEHVVGMDCDFRPVLPPKSYLHASSSFGSQKADDSSWSSRSKLYEGREKDDDEMSTVTNASTHYYVDDVPQTPRRPLSILDGESPYDGIVYGCVGVGVLIAVGIFVFNRIIKRGRSH